MALPSPGRSTHLPPTPGHTLEVFWSVCLRVAAGVGEGVRRRGAQAPSGGVRQVREGGQSKALHLVLGDRPWTGGHSGGAELHPVP